MVHPEQHGVLGVFGWWDAPAVLGRATRRTDAVGRTRDAADGRRETKPNDVALANQKSKRRKGHVARGANLPAGALKKKQNKNENKFKLYSGGNLLYSNLF